MNNGTYLTYDDLEDYAEKAHSSLIYLILQMMQIGQQDVHYVGSHVGVCTGIVTLLRGYAFNAQMVRSVASILICVQLLMTTLCPSPSERCVHPQVCLDTIQGIDEGGFVWPADGGRQEGARGRHPWYGLPGLRAPHGCPEPVSEVGEQGGVAGIFARCEQRFVLASPGKKQLRSLRHFAAVQPKDSLTVPAENNGHTFQEDLLNVGAIPSLFVIFVAKYTHTKAQLRTHHIMFKLSEVQKHTSHIRKTMLH